MLSKTIGSEIFYKRLMLIRVNWAYLKRIFAGELSSRCHLICFSTFSLQEFYLLLMQTCFVSSYKISNCLPWFDCNHASHKFDSKEGKYHCGIPPDFLKLWWKMKKLIEKAQVESCLYCDTHILVGAKDGWFRHFLKFQCEIIWVADSLTICTQSKMSNKNR